MALRALIIPAPKAQGALKILDRRGWMPHCFLPRPECLLQAVQVVRVQFGLRECLPDLGIGRTNGKNAPAQFHHRRLVRRVFGGFELHSQLRKWLVRAQQRITGAQEQENKQ
jgi:hypothetical protein